MVAGQDRLLTQMRRGTLEYCVLALLRDEQRYAVDLVRVLGTQEGMVTSEGTIYPLLSRLRRDGLVESNWAESPSGPPRRYYHLTADGRKALAAFTDEWERFRDAVDRFLEGDADGKRHPAPSGRRLPGRVAAVAARPSPATS
jgi:PadR family transcriptional regulator, regulatory protein PadR